MIIHHFIICSPSIKFCICTPEILRQLLLHLLYDILVYILYQTKVRSFARGLMALIYFQNSCQPKFKKNITIKYLQVPFIYYVSFLMLWHIGQGAELWPLSKFSKYAKYTFLLCMLFIARTKWTKWPGDGTNVVRQKHVQRSKVALLFAQSILTFMFCFTATKIQRSVMLRPQYTTSIVLYLFAQCVKYLQNYTINGADQKQKSIKDQRYQSWYYSHITQEMTTSGKHAHILWVNNF